MNSRIAEKLAPWVFTIAIFVIWEASCRVFRINTSVLQPPSAAFAAMARHWSVFLYHSYVTLWVTMVGFALAVGFGIALGLVVGWSRTIYRGLYPVMVGFNTIPKVAIVPLLILWFGIGEVPAIITAFLISFFPIVVNVATGLATTEPELEDVLRALGAGKLDIMRKVGIPARAAVPVRVAEGGDHARLRRHRGVRDAGGECGSRLHDRARGRELQDGERLRRAAAARVRGRADVRAVRLDRAVFYALGLPFADERGRLMTDESSALWFLLRADGASGRSRRRVQCHGGANERLQRLFINLVALMEIDGTPGVAFEAGVEEA